MNRVLGEKLLESARHGQLEEIKAILNKDPNLLNYTDEVVLILFSL